MALFQEYEASMTSDEACSTGDEHAPAAHVCKRSILLILDQLHCESLTALAIQLTVAHRIGILRGRMVVLELQQEIYTQGRALLNSLNPPDSLLE
tara:strand:- start:178 stop:462 length:285 start_codon:yes stop_codon:yes gene_type:complete